MISTAPVPQDTKTAQAFAASWNNLPEGSVYTTVQFEDWLAPLTQSVIQGHRVLELGCGNGSLMVHMTTWNPSYLEGVDLGDSVLSAEHNLKSTAFANWKVTKADLTEYRSDGFDVVYCIGVLHHLKDPTRGLDAVIRNTKPGGRFHAWVYAREGNGGVIWIVDPIRKIASRLPWWLTKYVIATPLVIPFYIYSKTLAWLQRWYMLEWLPLYRYALWISPREFAFFRHVAFDQLVTPQTAYISKSTIEAWLKSNAVIDPRSTYIIMRNGNSWKFGGQVII